VGCIYGCCYEVYRGAWWGVEYVKSVGGVWDYRLSEACSGEVCGSRLD